MGRHFEGIKKLRTLSHGSFYQPPTIFVFFHRYWLDVCPQNCIYSWIQALFVQLDQSAVKTEQLCRAWWRQKVSFVYAHNVCVLNNTSGPLCSTIIKQCGVRLHWRVLHWVLCCFSIFWIVSNIVFKSDTLATCEIFNLSERQVGLGSMTLSVSSAAPIAHLIQVLEAICTVEQKGSGLCD